MSERDDSHFDDPGLKAALQRTCAGERAPAHLREKIVNLMVSSEPATSTRAGSSRWRMFLGPNRRGTLIAAGIAVLAVMVAAYQVKEYLFPGLLGGSRSGVIAATKLPDSFAMEMVKTHENCAKLSDHHLIAGDDLAKLKEALTSAAHVPVSAAPFNGWQFKGAGACKVNGITTAHLLYANAQGQTFSVFELTADAVYGAPSGAKYTQTAGGHVVSGLVHGTGLYCVVGSDGAQAMTKAQVEQLRDQLAATLPEVGCGGGGSDTVARL